MSRVVVAGTVLLLAACGGGGGSGTDLEPGPSAAGFAFTAMSDVADGKPIGQRFTCDGEDVAPTLVWTGVPNGAKQLALALEDPDAPDGTFTHWLVYGLDPSMTRLPDGGLSEGENDFDDTGYRGPCPPEGEEHRYVFRLLALDARTELEPGADRPAFDDAVQEHVLAEARLTARYRRS